MQDTCSYVGTHSTDFAGVPCGDGFANTIPWTASSTEPVQISAIDKHPYPPLVNLPGGDQNPSYSINALGQLDPPGSFLPTYTAYFPEYAGTMIQTESAVRDMGPITNSTYGTLHGRNARTVNGHVLPCPVWLMEANIAPSDINGGISASNALAIKAKDTLRFYCFYLNKGVTQLDLYAAAPNNSALGDTELGLIQQNFLTYAQSNMTYPADDTAYTSPALAALARVVARMNTFLDPRLTTTRPLSITSLSDTHNHAQFVGDGTAAHPNLFDRELFTFLPYQVNAHRFVIPYYVMTRNVMPNGQMESFTPEQFTFTVSGVNGASSTVTAYDPINNVSIPVTVRHSDSSTLTLTVTATNYPYLLTIDDSTPFAINAGGSASGSFVADTDFNMGSTTGSTTATINTSAVTNPAPQAVYQTRRTGSHRASLVYTIPNLTAGVTYSVRLHFAETLWTASGQRVLNVSINNTPVLSNFDVFRAAGGANKAIAQQFTATANGSGQIVIAFSYGSAGNPMVSGIEIHP